MLAMGTSNVMDYVDSKLIRPGKIEVPDPGSSSKLDSMRQSGQCALGQRSRWSKTGNNNASTHLQLDRPAPTLDMYIWGRRESPTH